MSNGVAVCVGKVQEIRRRVNSNSKNTPTLFFKNLHWKKIVKNQIKKTRVYGKNVFNYISIFFISCYSEYIYLENLLKALILFEKAYFEY
mgnify:CR=1 FL=1